MMATRLFRLARLDRLARLARPRVARRARLVALARPFLPLALAGALLGACAGGVGDQVDPGAGTTARPGGSAESPIDPKKGAPPGKPAPDDPDVPAVPPEALPPRVYAGKVKDLLTGLALAPDELAAVTAKPAALKTLVDGWMATDQFRARMFEFWKGAFQQTQLEPPDLDEQIKLTSLTGPDQERMLRSIEESFTRTVGKLVEEGRPFSETVTTTRFMLNLPMMAALAYMDAAPLNDLAKDVPAGFWHLTKYKGFKYTQTKNLDPVTGLQVPIPFAESIDPLSPNFMRFTYAQAVKPDVKPCADPGIAMGPNAIHQVWRALFGRRALCGMVVANPSVFSEEDWNTWRMITIRKPKDGEERTTFWEVPKLRDKATTELVLATPRVGFFTTPAFFANWPTNPSNQYRVTTNQAIIVALGHTFDDPEAAVQLTETSVEAAHVQPGTACFGCHQTLDPIRDFFKQSYSLSYFQQLDTANPKNPLPAQGVFTLSDPAPKGFGVEALARAIVAHPDFGVAWAQKLCHLANANRCPDGSPELARVVQAFVASKHDWKTLVRELFTSPLVTFASPPEGQKDGAGVMSIARRDAFCTRMSNRLGVVDVCNQRGESTLRKIASPAKNLSAGIPGSGYSRADENPVMPHDPNIFFMSATEKLCGLIAAQLVETKEVTGLWKVAAKEAAFTDFVGKVMGVPGNDPRAPKLVEILAKHYTAALTKENATEALRSTFTLACSSPIAISSGL